jgi:hypothetical protein
MLLARQSGIPLSRSRSAFAEPFEAMADFAEDIAGFEQAMGLDHILKRKSPVGICVQIPMIHRTAFRSKTGRDSEN